MPDRKVFELLSDAIQHAKAGKGKDAFDDLARARYYLMDDEEVYREPLVNAFDRAFKAAWKIYKAEEAGKDPNPDWVRTIEREVERIEELIENPRGEKANPPTRVKSPRDSRLWSMAQMIVNDEYPEIEEGSERYWALVSRIFTRMKLRLGGLKEKKVEEIVEELREKYGELPSPGGKKGKDVLRLKERALREELKKLLLRLVLKSLWR